MPAEPAKRGPGEHGPKTPPPPGQLGLIGFLVHECWDNRRVPRVAQSFCQHLLRAVHRSQVLDMLTGIPYLRVCSLPRRTPIAANSSCTRLEISPIFGAILSAQFTHGSNDFSDLSTVWAYGALLPACKHSQRGRAMLVLHPDVA